MPGIRVGVVPGVPVVLVLRLLLALGAVLLFGTGERSSQPDAPAARRTAKAHAVLLLRCVFMPKTPLDSHFGRSPPGFTFNTTSTLQPPR